MRLFLGVDGGQSSTVAVIADESGRVLGSGRGGPCNHVAAREGRAKFVRAISESVGTACAEAGLDMKADCFEAACLGFSGGIADKEAYSREFIRSKQFLITIDADVALTGATGGNPGIIVIAGTGSIAFGKNASGKTSRAGGWGYIFGDEGGAFDIVRQALRVSLAMEEGWGAKTLLRDMFLEHTGAETVNSLLHEWYNQFDRTQVAQFALLVDGAAGRGDAAAAGMLQNAGRQLAELVLRVHKMLFHREEDVQISYIGGVFGSSLLTSALQSALRDAIGVNAKPPALPPAAGALLQALRMAGINVVLSGTYAFKS